MKPTNVFARLSAELQDVADPLAPLGVSAFTYFKRFSDGAEVQLSNTPDWMEYFYRNKLYDLSECWYSEESSVVYQVWPPSNSYEIFKSAWDHFKQGVGLLVEKRFPGYSEFYFFKAANMEMSTVSRFINHFDVFERFILYFREQYSEVIAKADCYKQRLVQGPQEKTFVVPKDEHLKECILSGLKTSYRYNLGGINVDLSPRELDCALAVLNRYTAREISDQLGLSERTVEIHIRNIKEKLHCDSKKSLIHRLGESDLSDIRFL